MCWRPSSHARAETEWARRQADFLADASALFDQSLDAVPDGGAVAALAVRDFADTSVVLVGGSVAAVAQVASDARDAGPPGDLARGARTLPAAVAVPGIRSARCWPAAARASSTSRSSCSSGPACLRPTSSCCATGHPLVDPGPAARPRPDAGRHGASASLGLRPGAEDDLLALFEDLGRRAALAIDNARLYAERAARRQDAPALAAATGPPGRARRRAGRPLPRRRRGRRRRRRLLRLLRDRRRRLGARHRRRLRQGRRGGDRSPRWPATRVRASVLHSRRPVRRARRAQRGDPAPGPGLPVLHRAVRRR